MYSQKAMTEEIIQRGLSVALTSAAPEKALSPAFVALVQASAGAAGGVFASFVLQPLEVAKTRIAIGQSQSSSALPTLAAIYDEEGLNGVFRGVAAKCTETGTKNFVYFYLYDFLNTFMKNRSLLTGRMKLALGYIAGAGNAISTMPLEVIATRLQTETGTVTFFVLLRKILSEEGIRGLFKGFWSNIMLCVNPAIQNACFDWMKAVTLKAKRASNQKPVLTPFQAFLFGALAKAVATFFTFPLVRLKTILQAGKQLKDVNGKEEESSNGSSKENGSGCPLATAMDPKALLRMVMGMYRGLGSMLAKSVAQAAILYMVKDQVEQIVVRLFKLTAKMLRRKGGGLKIGGFSGRPLAS
mmetsp:Transcript_18269/g.42756  ORF Transcript_18269/g.42756 Transcript_18269/m.42756 type:complete len:356 (-) Transcript_18269:335-1402(-)